MKRGRMMEKGKIVREQWRGMRRETLGDRVHAYATISFDYIIVFRPGGIIRVNKLHIFFYFTSPFLHDRPCPSSSHCRDSVVANSRRLFDLLSRHFSLHLSCASRTRYMSLVARSEIILFRLENRLKVCKVFTWGLGMKFLIQRENGRQTRRYANGLFVVFYLDV